MPSDEMHEALTDMAQTLEAAGLFDEATRVATAGLLADHEWTRPRWVHLHSLVEYFAVGVIGADPWHRGYMLPPNFTEVVNGIAARLQARWPGEDVVQVSLFDFEQLVREGIAADPKALAWNEVTPGEPTVAVVTRYSPTPDRRDFIDLDALARCAAIAFRDASERQEEFDRRFQAEQDNPDTPDASH